MPARVDARIVIAETAVVEHPRLAALLPQLLHLVSADNIQALELDGAQLLIEQLQLFVHTLLVLAFCSTFLTVQTLGSAAPHLALQLQEFSETLTLISRDAQEVSVGVVSRDEGLAAKGQVGAAEGVLAVGELSAAAQRIGGRGLVIAEVLLL